jgi:proteic killer suppression protein
MPMDVEFRDSALDRLETDASFSAGFPGAIVKAYRKKMQMMRAAPDERSFYALKSLHFEKLKGDRSHQCSMKLNDQWRLVLEMIGSAPEKAAVIVTIEDYH